MNAIIDSSGRYRYTLERQSSRLVRGPVYLYIGVNPSTADASFNDATVRKWIGFTTSFGSTLFLVGNVFAARATDVRLLADMDDPVGPANDEHLIWLCSRADIIVPCWGNETKAPRELRHQFGRVRRMLVAVDKPTKVFGLTKRGDPCHPLMLPYSTPLRDWRPI